MLESGWMVGVDQGRTATAAATTATANPAALRIQRRRMPRAAEIGDNGTLAF